MIFISLLIFIVAIALPSFKKQLSPILLTRITTIILIYSGVLAFNSLYIQSIGSGIGIYSGLFHVSAITQVLDSFLLFIAALILIPRPGILEFNNSKSNGHGPSLIKIVNSDSGSGLGDKYSLIILFSTLGSLLLLSSSDLLSMYLSIELQSFGVYILATLFRNSKLATSAGLKYFLLGGLSSCIILLGSGLVYSYTGLTNLESIYSLISVVPSGTVSSVGYATGSFCPMGGEAGVGNITQGLTLGFVLIIIGFLFKIAAAPLHNWAPDVYDESPTIVTIWLTIMPKIGILIFLLDLFIGGSAYSQSGDFILSNGYSSGYGLVTSSNGYLLGGDILKNLLLISSLLSLIIGTVVGLAQSKIKRLFAYSTISHIGFILLALAINSEQSIESFIFYIIQYSITNLNTFLIILALGYLIKNAVPSLRSRPSVISSLFNLESKDIRFISELKGQFISNPLLSISLAICLFSMAGIPPLIGFFSKQMVLYSAIQSGYYFMAIVCIIVSVISTSYYLKIVRVLFNPSPSTGATHPSSAAAMPQQGRVAGEASHLNGSSPVSVESNIKISYYITNIHSFLISTLTLFILLFIFKPSLLLNSTQLLSLSLFNC
uniref:NADH dehydrogenase subunit 2 n=1 Tax=Pallidohirschioporus biformis TaxID=50381 RepID=UPI002E761C36|nr:NADH dehydrogenase subunit 2 [Pallidohirschioporus biformis]WQA11130.1 NADH dehydrogenase subunit 2 [Pallidohirschioporus biformis]